MSDKKIYLYSDGGSQPNPGVGGFGVILKFGNHSKEFYQGYSHTTNNRMEMMGIIYGLEKINRQSNVIIVSDSKYVVDAINKGWLKQWKQNNWGIAKIKKILNIDLWKRLDELISHHSVEFRWTKGHSGHKENERCHDLATKALEQNKKNLKKDLAYTKQQEKNNISDSKLL